MKTRLELWKYCIPILLHTGLYVLKTIFLLSGTLIIPIWTLLLPVSSPSPNTIRLRQPQQAHFSQQLPVHNGQWFCRLHQPERGVGQRELPYQEALQVPTCAPSPCRPKRYEVVTSWSCTWWRAGPNITDLLGHCLRSCLTEGKIWYLTGTCLQFQCAHLWGGSIDLLKSLLCRVCNFPCDFLFAIEAKSLAQTYRHTLICVLDNWGGKIIHM